MQSDSTSRTSFLILHRLLSMTEGESHALVQSMIHTACGYEAWRQLNIQYYYGGSMASKERKARKEKVNQRLLQEGQRKMTQSIPKPQIVPFTSTCPCHDQTNKVPLTRHFCPNTTRTQTQNTPKPDILHASA
eukprot:2739937-Amphidinium_carterae.2